MTEPSPPRVFISYSHDSLEHKERVLALSNRLRGDGIDARIDQYQSGTPDRGWPIWMHDEIDMADFVLVVCTETYERRQLRRESPGVGLGATWEAGIITQLLYEEQGRGRRCLPVVFDRRDAAHIPVFMRDATRYQLDHESGYTELRDCLLGVHATPMPPLGTPMLDQVGSSGSLTPPHRQAAPPGVTFAGRDVVVIRFGDGSLHAFGAERIEVADQVTLELVAVADGGSEQLQRLHHLVQPGSFRGAQHIAVAFGSVPTATAIWLDVRELSHRIGGGLTRWRLVGSAQRAEPNLYDDMTVNSFSAAQIAELRARRILLDERRVPGASRSARGDGAPSPSATDSLTESLISGSTSFVGSKPSLGAVEGSPFTALYRGWKTAANGRNDFLAVAKLVASMWLVLTRTVQFVRRLEIQFAGPDTLSIRFEGERGRVYTNRDPDVITVEGECNLRT